MTWVEKIIIKIIRKNRKAYKGSENKRPIITS
jgi:hypothetical protein